MNSIIPSDNSLKGYISNIFDKKANNYSENITLRALVQLIPNIGGALDTILYEKGSKWRQERIEYFIKYFEEKINELIKENNLLSEKINKVINSEDFYDLFLKALKDSTSTKYKEKINYYANILINYVNKIQTPEDSEIMIEILSQQLNSEIYILTKIYSNNSKITLYNYNNAFIFWNELKQYLEKNIIKLKSNDDIPKEYIFNDNNLYLLNKLESNFLLTRQEYVNGELLSYTHKKTSQTTTYQVNMTKKEYKLTDFGKKYLEWILINQKRE